MNPLTEHMAKQEQLWAHPQWHRVEVAMHERMQSYQQVREAYALRQMVAGLSDTEVRIHNQRDELLEQDPVYAGSVDERVRTLMFGRALLEKIYTAILDKQGKPAESMADVGIVSIYSHLPASRRRVARKMFMDKITQAEFLHYSPFPKLEDDQYLISLPLEEKLGHQIKTFRKLQKIKQVEVARRLGVSPATLSRIEAGKMLPSNKVITEICGILGIPQESAQKMGAQNLVPVATTSYALTLEQHEFIRLYRHLSRTQGSEFLNTLVVKVEQEERVDENMRNALQSVGLPIPAALQQ